MPQASNHIAPVPAVPIAAGHAPILGVIVRLVAGFTLLILVVSLTAAMVASSACVAAGVSGLAAGGVSRWLWHEAKRSRRLSASG